MSVYVRVRAPPQVIRAQQTRAPLDGDAPFVLLEDFDEAVGEDVGDGRVHGREVVAVVLELVEPLLALCPVSQDEEEEGREEQEASVVFLPDVVQNARRVSARVGHTRAPLIPQDRVRVPVDEREFFLFLLVAAASSALPHLVLEGRRFLLNDAGHAEKDAQLRKR